MMRARRRSSMSRVVAAAVLPHAAAGNASALISTPVPACAWCPLCDRETTSYDTISSNMRNNTFLQQLGNATSALHWSSPPIVHVLAMIYVTALTCTGAKD